MTVFDFLATQNAGDLIRLLEGVVGVVGAVLSGAALRNIIGLRKMIGQPIRKTLREVLHGLLPRGRTRRAENAVSVMDRPLTLEQKIDLLKTNQERHWIEEAIREQRITERLDRVDPPTRRN